MHLYMTKSNLEVQKCNKYLYLFLKEISERKQLQDLDSTEEEVVEFLMTQLDGGHIIKLRILLPHVTHWDATHEVGLVTEPKNV